MSEEVDTVEEMLRAAAEAGEGFEPAALLHELARLPERDARGALEKLVQRKKAEAVPLLMKLASIGAASPAVAAAEILGTIRDRAAASALQVLATGADASEVRKAARRGLHRLASQGISPSPAAPLERAPEAAAVTDLSFASPIDGAGNRALWFGFGRGSEVQMLGMVLSDERGILDLVDADMSRSKFDKEVSRLLQDEDLPWVEMPVDYCRHLVEEAHRLNAASGTPLPLEYLSWRERIGKPRQQYPQPLAYSVLNAAEVRWDPRHLDRSGELFDLEMFRMWLLPREEMAEFVRERLTAQQSGILLAGVNAEARDRMVVDRAIQRLFDLRRRALYKRRLEEMAYHLWKLDRTERARMALAAALAFDPPDRTLQDHPFVRQMVEWSLEVIAAAAQGERARTIRPGVQLHLPY